MNARMLPSTRRTRHRLRMERSHGRMFVRVRVRVRVLVHVCVRVLVRLTRMVRSVKYLSFFLAVLSWWHAGYIPWMYIVSDGCTDISSTSLTLSTLWAVVRSHVGACMRTSPSGALCSPSRCSGICVRRRYDSKSLRNVRTRTGPFIDNAGPDDTPKNSTRSTRTLVAWQRHSCRL